ncbi:MAG: hypothetical protein WA090_09245, partial [Candidatus Nanopelagicaceae bacterium]
ADGWRAELRDFYAEHAGFVAAALHVNAELAMAYATEHADRLAANGIVIMDDQWERQEAETLTRMACEEDDMVPGGPIQLRIINTPPQPAHRDHPCYDASDRRGD